MGVQYNEVQRRTTFEQGYPSRRNQSQQQNHKSIKMTTTIKPQTCHKGLYANYGKLTTDFDNPKWIGRHKHMFNFLDVNGNGKITLNELVFKANEEICKKIGATKEQTERQQKCVEAFFGGCGMEYDKEVEWPEYIEGWKKFATAELEKWKRNQTTVIRLWGDALFDIIDKDQSGTITFDEWRFYTKCAGIIQNEKDARRTFEICDLDESGSVEIDEMTRQHVGFWYSCDPACDNLYGGAVP